MSTNGTSGALCKRIIPCLDVANGTTVKGINFTNLRTIGDPVALGLMYEEQGADELTFLDISASVEERATVVELVERVADNLSIPFTVGGGISTLADAKRLLEGGADKVSINTAAVTRPELISEIASAWGSQCCVVAIDARAIAAAGATASRASADRGNATDGATAGIWKPGDSPVAVWEVLIKGGRVATGRDAFEWAKECVERGAGEILLTSWDRDGTLSGFDLPMVRAFAESLPVPVIASGGARDPDSFVDVFKDGSADAALAASIFHDGTYTISQVKERLRDAGVPVRI
jgi:cyclase